MKKVCNKGCKAPKVLGWLTVAFVALAVIGLSTEGVDYATLALMVLMGFDAYYLIKK